MRLIDRLYQFIAFKGLSAYAFERSCELSNGYLHKQSKGGGSVGSDVLERIHHVYPDLSLIWLITGKGSMLFGDDDTLDKVHDGGENYVQGDTEVLKLLYAKIKLLETSVSDKDKIIALLESSREKKSKS